MLPIIKFDNVSKIKKSIDSKDIETSKTILNNISFSLNKGDILNIIGHSGSGKTSLLRLINRLDDQTSGTISINGKNIKEYKINELRRKVAMTFQIPIMFDGTVQDNLLSSLRFKLDKKKFAHLDKSFLKKYLNLVRLDESFLERNSSDISVGEKQRVAIIRSLVNEPDILLLDEPTASIDEVNSRAFLENIKVLNQELSLTILLVTHKLDHAFQMGGKTMILDKGNLIEMDETKNIFEKTKNDITQNFLNGVAS